MYFRQCSHMLQVANTRPTLFKIMKRLVSYSLISSEGITLISHLAPKYVVFGVRCLSSYPPHNVIKLPNLSPTMETGTIVSWAKMEGDEVAEGDLLAEIETDKATMSFDSSENGFLAKILTPSGSKDIPVGTPLCVLVEEAGMVAAFKDYKAVEQAPMKSVAAAPVKTAQQSETSPLSTVSTIHSEPLIPTATSSPGQRLFVSPLARRIANEKGIDLTKHASMVSGTGMGGMIRSTDLIGIPELESGMQMPVATGVFADVAVTNIRTVIATRLTESKQNIPHYYLTADIEMNEIQLVRSNINANLNKTSSANKVDGSTPKISLNDFFIKAISMACLKVPACNASWQGEFIRQYHNVDVSVAVATDSGLITPIIFSAEKKGLVQINQELRKLVSKAKSNQLKPQEFQGGTFTISNLGMFGITSFSAIINPPQVCILAVGSPRSCLLPHNNDLGFRKATLMSVTLCCDHRVVDGAVGADWLSEFKSLLENPTLMLV